MEQQIGFPPSLLAKGRLESFETTDMVWATKLVPPPAEKVEVTGAESQETALAEKTSPKKELRRFPSKAQDKIKNKIKKLKGFWKERQRMMPHMFKLLFREETEAFELHDLSLKGAVGGKGEEAEREAPDEEENWELCDISRDIPIDFEAL